MNNNSLNALLLFGLPLLAIWTVVALYRAPVNNYNARTVISCYGFMLFTAGAPAVASNLLLPIAGSFLYGFALFVGGIPAFITGLLTVAIFWCLICLLPKRHSILIGICIGFLVGGVVGLAVFFGFQAIIYRYSALSLEFLKIGIPDHGSTSRLAQIILNIILPNYYNTLMLMLLGFVPGGVCGAFFFGTALERLQALDPTNATSLQVRDS
jgi:hypothetical protein